MLAPSLNLTTILDFNSIKGGLNYKLDWWVGNNRFLDLFSYQDIGIKWNGQETKFVYSPSVGIGLGSLIGIKYYNMPAWLRLPLQYLLPLKFRWTADIVKDKKAIHLLFIELDVLF